MYLAWSQRKCLGMWSCLASEGCVDARLDVYLSPKACPWRFSQLLQNTLTPVEASFIARITAGALCFVCSRSAPFCRRPTCPDTHRFLGTFGSTFSSYISRVRSYHSAALVPDKGVYFTNYPDTPVRRYARLPTLLSTRILICP